MKKNFLILTAMILILGLAGAAFAQSPIKVSHKLGTIEVKPNPEKIVVMDFGFLDSIAALDVPVKLAVPKSNVPAYLSQFKADEYVDVGGLKEFNLETINAFKPDLIIISARQQDYYQDLSEIAPTYFVDNLSTQYMEDFKKRVMTSTEVLV